ncbi:histidine kinase [Eubacterium pyruvativorans]|uniref:histidine kinase n=1 Tax=Eubacterium pyruvativorans TaxID=155865 RepID=UPI0008835B65|nr:histidine kinase [Eubacterium pyruvativorans]SDE92829.1 PocR sensory domain-containing protein [Eubacterium pyruvativorans]
MRQETEWGYIDWEYLPEKDEENRWMSVGITTILPGSTQSPHVHYGHEQFLYVLEGTGISRINGEEARIHPGMYRAIRPNSIHEVINTGEIPLREILISVPVPLQVSPGPTGPVSWQAYDPGQNDRLRHLLYNAVSELKPRLLNDICIPFCLYDKKKQIVLHNASYPELCHKCCNPAFHPEACACYSASLTNAAPEENHYVFTCSKQMKCYLMPIRLGDRMIGVLRGGQHYSSPNPAGGQSENYDTPRSTEQGILHVMEQIQNSIQSYCMMCSSISKLEDQKHLLNASAQENTALKKNLNEVQEKITNLKINHHFLFNTLNSMAAMALTGDRYDLYTSIVNLSKMFRYTMVTDMKMVSLKREIEYLQTYLSLQKLRYGDGLRIEYNIDDHCLNTPVPFNFLQPIVENAFTHGFMSYDYEKYVCINVAPKQENICIEVINNGIPPGLAELKQIREGWASHSGHGLSLIYDKLQYSFAGQFSMDIRILKGGKTCILLQIPITTGS